MRTTIHRPLTMSIHRPAPALLLPGTLALLVGLAVALRWETVVQLFFMVGLVPAMAACAWGAARLWQASASLAVRWRVRAVAVATALWLVLLLAFSYGPWHATQGMVAAGSIALGLVSALLALAEWRGPRVAAAWALALAMQFGLYLAIDGQPGLEAARAELATVEQQISQATGTPAWASQGQALVRRKAQQEATIEALLSERWQRLGRVPLQCAAVSLLLGGLMRRRFEPLGLAFFIAAGLQALLGLSHLATVAPQW